MGDIYSDNTHQSPVSTTDLEDYICEKVITLINRCPVFSLLNIHYNVYSLCVSVESWKKPANQEFSSLYIYILYSDIFYVEVL